MSEHRTAWIFTSLRNAAEKSKTAFIDGDWIEAPYITNSGIRLIQTGNIGRGYLIEKASSQKYISHATFQELRCSWVHSGDILVCRLADPIGRACIVPERFDKSVTSVDVTIMRVNQEQFHPHFILHYLNSDRILKRAADVAGGSTRSRISRTNLGNLELSAPPLLQQQKIAQILDTLDAQIQQTEALIAKLEKIKEGLLHDLLTRGIGQNGQLRPTPQQAPELYKDSTLGLIPREWKVCTTGEISRSIVPGRDKPKLSDTGIPWITISDLSEDRVSKSMLGLYVDERQIRTSMIRTIPAGSVIMSCVGEFGITSIAECETIINQQLHCFVVNSGIDADWLMYSLREKKNTIDRSATQTTIKYLNKTGCESIELPTPPLAEQTAIIGQVLPLTKRIEKEKKYSEKLAKTKNGVVDDLLTGRVRVTPPLKDAV